MTYPTSFVVEAKEMPPIVIPLWDTGLKTLYGGTFLPSSPDAVQQINLGATEANGNFYINGLKIFDYTNSKSCAFAGAGSGAFSMPTGTAYNGVYYQSIVATGTGNPTSVLTFNAH